MTRKRFLQELLSTILKLEIPHPLLIAIDSVDGSGKTTLANELAEELQSSGRQIIRISIDHFHNPKKIRYKKGPDSPEGFYFDSFDNGAIIENVLKPLGQEGSLRYKKSCFDYKNNVVIDAPTELAEKDAIVIFDGIFLQRPELIDYWDLKIFLEADFSTTVARAIARDGYYQNSKEATVKRYNERYVPGQEIYFREARPKEVADIVIDNNTLENPTIIKNYEWLHD